MLEARLAEDRNRREGEELRDADGKNDRQSGLPGAREARRRDEGDEGRTAQPDEEESSAQSETPSGASVGLGVGVARRIPRPWPVMVSSLFEAMVGDDAPLAVLSIPKQPQNGPPSSLKRKRAP